MRKALCFALMLSACGTYAWVKDGATPELVHADSLQCVRDAQYRASLDSTARPLEEPPGPRGGGVTSEHVDFAQQRDGYMRQCLAGLGYRLRKVDPGNLAPVVPPFAVLYSREAQTIAPGDNPPR
jgi:hypothetical protein